MTSLPTDFVLPVDKPEGPTSHDVVQAARRALGIRRVGHTGTLDPFASGLMLLCVGRATRLAEYLTGLDKTYEAVGELGTVTDTLDREGSVVAESDAWRRVTRDEVEAVLSTFVGELEQVPPEYSAKKVDGERAYRRARRGERVELRAETVHVHSLAMERFEPPRVAFRVRCSSGTYIRSLARDIGAALGCGAHLVSLRRVSVGAFEVADAVSMDALADRERVADRALSPLDALRHLPRVDVDDEGATGLAAGRSVVADVNGATGPLAVAHRGELLAIAEARDGMLRPRKVFAS